MAVTPLFHESNTFTIYKNNQDLKTINFHCHKVGLYYKLYSIWRKRHNYHTKTSTVRDITGRVLMNGSLLDIIDRLVEDLNTEHKFTITAANSEGGEVRHWRDDEKAVVEQLTHMVETYTRNGDPRLFSPVEVIDHDSEKAYYENLNDLIQIFSTREDAAEAEFGVYLSFEEVLNEMRPLITNGTEKEKIEAKAILAYVAVKMAGN